MNDQKQIVLFVRGIDSPADFDRAKAAILRTSGVQSVDQRKVPGQDGSEALAKQVLIAYEPAVASPEQFKTELTDEGFMVVLQEELGDEHHEIDPLHNVKTD
jgi:hypothetical protein